MVRQGATPRKELGPAFVEAGAITLGQWQQAQNSSRENGNRAEQYLVTQGWITHDQLTLFTSLHLGVPYLNLNRQEIQPEALALVPEWIARKYGVIPMSLQDGVLRVAIEDPTNLEALEALAAVSLKRIEAFISSPQDIQEAIGRHYRVGGEIERQLNLVIRGGESENSRSRVDREASARVIAQAPVVRALDLLLTQAVLDRASDVHIEPQEDHLRIRFRTDGILREVLTLSLEAHAPLLSRIKIMAGMNIAERRRPQDGQITFRTRDKEVDVRVATSNTIYGEMSVMRILDKTFAFYTLPQLGFLPETLKTYQQMLKTPFGMLLMSGPTGSGKTTTLYASVSQLDSVGRNILTIEDPVEYRFGNINQMQVNPTAGVTFAAGLRACMRLDPNIILVGEIRDPETAQIAIQAALTGHLVLSSVHANDTVGVIARLVDLGSEPFMIASAVVGIVAQRMVRRICANCAQSRPALPEERLAYNKELGEDRHDFLYGAGCNLCSGSGYSGRTGIYEVMVVSEEVRRLILSGAGTDDLRAQAHREGMISLWHDGMIKVRMGITTPSEVIRNVFTIS